MARVLLDGLGKRFGSVAAVRDVTLEVRDGEFLSFLGPSGCGKTTTLNMIAGLEAPSGGRILIGDRDVTRVPAKQRDVAMVFQSYALYPHMTVFRNLDFALRVRGLPESEITPRVRRAAEMLELGPLLERFPRQLSGGQRQRVALGRALVRDPQAFLLDEPLSNLDAVLRVQTRAELRRLFSGLRATAVYVTHDQSEAMTMSDRIAVFEHGRLQQVDTPLGIYRNPANLFVARFVGNPPMSVGEAVAEPDGRVAAFGLSLPLAPPPGPPGTRLWVGVRPEDVLVGDAPDAVAMQVDLLEHLGSVALVYLSRGGALLTAQMPATAAPRVGEMLPVRIEPASLYVFAHDGGAALRTPGGVTPR